MYQRLLKHAVLHFGSEDVLHFFGKKRFGGPLASTCRQLFLAVMRGEHTIQGLRNGDLCAARSAATQRDSETSRRHSARVSRLLKLLHLHGLLAKIPRTHRWRTTVLGCTLMVAAFQNHEEITNALLVATAA